MPKDNGNSNNPRKLHEIQRAHDVLKSIAEDNIFPNLDEGSLARIEDAADVLCWILGHKSEFGWRMQNTEALLADMGIKYSIANNPKTS